MKKRISLIALAINFIFAFAASMLFAQAVPSVDFNPVVSAAVITTGFAAITYFAPLPNHSLFAGLQKEVWIADLQKNPIPDNSFISHSKDLSGYVNNNTLHLAEAGVDPDVHLNYFSQNDVPLPIQAIDDIPHEVLLQIWSTNRTKHNKLLEAELSYDKRADVLNRHRDALAKSMGKRTAFAWSPQEQDAFNKVMAIGPTDSVLDAITDLKMFFKRLDLDVSKFAMILQADHEARILKEDKKLYNQVFNENGGNLYGFKVFQYSQTPYYDATGKKKAFGSVVGETDKQATIFWSSEEVFRCTGDVEVYADLADAGWQADLFSMAQRALNGKIRANAPKYFGAIL